MFVVGFPGLSLLLLILWHSAIIQEVNKLCISGSYFPRQCQVGHESPHYHHCHHCQHLSHLDEIYFNKDSAKSHPQTITLIFSKCKKIFLRGHISMIAWVEHIAVIVKIRKKSKDLTWVCTTLPHLWYITDLYLKISPPLKILWCMKCCLHSSSSTEKAHIFDGTIFDASNT